MSLRRSLGFFVVVVLGAGLAPTAATSAQPNDDRAAIQALVDRRAAAIRERDRAEFLGTLSDASPAFVDRQTKLFEWMADVPLGSYELQVRWDRYGDLARPSDRARYPGAEDVTIPLTEERYRIRGYDERPALEDMFYTYLKEDGEWAIAEDTDVEDLALYSARHLWDFGPVVPEESAHFLALSHPCGYSGVGPNRAGPCARLPEGALALAEDALSKVERFWTRPWAGRVAVVTPATDGELGRMIQATFDLDAFVAFAYSTIDLDRGLNFTGYRIILNPAALSGRSAAGTSTVLTHELLHIATRSYSGPFVPVFVEEGFAEYVGYAADPASLGFLRSEIAAGRFDRKLPEDFEFLTGDDRSIYRSYQESESAVLFFIDRWGARAFERFYVSLGRVGTSPGTTRYHVDRALRRTIDESYRSFEKAWASSLAT